MYKSFQSFFNFVDWHTRVVFTTACVFTAHTRTTTHASNLTAVHDKVSAIKMFQVFPIIGKIKTNVFFSAIYQ